MNQLTLVGGIIGTGLGMAFAPTARAAVTLYLDLPSYQSDGGYDGITVDFESIPANTNIDGQTLSGARFNRIGSPLIVVDGASTFTPVGLFSDCPDPSTNTLIPTTGARVLSPGGVELGSGVDLDQDSIEITLGWPVQSMAFDMMYQSLDGFSSMSFAVYDSDGNEVFNADVPAGVSFNGNAGGVQFYGLISDGLPITTVVIKESDGNLFYPDANIGIDTLRYPMPTPGVGLALGMGLVGLGRRRRS